MALRILRSILFVDKSRVSTQPPPCLTRIIMYTETRISSRLEAATAFLLRLEQGNRNTTTEFANSQADIVQAQRGSLNMTPAYMIVARRPSNTEIVGDRHGPFGLGRRQIARHDASVPGRDMAGQVVRTPRTETPPRHTSIALVAPQLPIPASSPSPTSLSEAMGMAIEDISKKAGQDAEEKEGPSSPTVLLRRRETGALTLRCESNDVVLQHPRLLDKRSSRFDWIRSSPLRQQHRADRVRSRSPYWRASDLSVTRSKEGGDIGPLSFALAVPVAAAAAAENSASSASSSSSEPSDT